MRREPRDHVEREIAALELWIGVEHNRNIHRVGDGAKIGFDLRIFQRKVRFEDRENAVGAQALIVFGLYDGIRRRCGGNAGDHRHAAVGRFDDHTQEWVDSKGERRSRVLPVLYHKAPASLDVSATACKDNPDGLKLKKEWPQAWEYYLKCKATAATAPPPIPTATEFGIKGTPIEDADFLGKDKLAYLKSLGFLTLEQLRDMSDSGCQNVGFGAKAWRKKAKEHLDVKAAGA